MKQKLIDILEQFCPNNVYLQGTIHPDVMYPSELVTFWTPSTDAAAHFDNAVTTINWTFSVIYYSDDPAKVNTKPFEIAAALKAAGFVQQGRGHDIPSDEATHTGWAMDFVCVERLY
jgi:hypothetical protein